MTENEKSVLVVGGVAFAVAVIYLLTRESGAAAIVTPSPSLQTLAGNLPVATNYAPSSFVIPAFSTDGLPPGVTLPAPDPSVPALPTAPNIATAVTTPTLDTSVTGPTGGVSGGCGCGQSGGNTVYFGSSADQAKYLSGATKTAAAATPSKTGWQMITSALADAGITLISGG